MGHYDNCRDDHFPDAGKMVEPLNTKPLTAADLVEMIAHKEQIGIWANEIATAISLGDMLKEDWSFDDSVDLEREIVAQLRDVLSSAFSHPAYDIATLITTQQQEIERLREALRPFADFSTADGEGFEDELFRIHDDHPLLGEGLGDDWHPVIYVKHFRAARVALSDGGRNDG